MKFWKKPTDEMIENALGSVKKEIDRQFFFSRLKNPLWIQPLAKRGYFQSPPSVIRLKDGSIQFPFWPELQFLKNVAKDAPDEVARIAVGLPEVDNPQVYYDILDIALRLHGEQSAKLKPKILDDAQIKHLFLSQRYSDLLNHWIAERQTTAALDLLRILVQFSPDPDSYIKQARRKENPRDWTTWLEPRPRFDQWDYQEIMEQGVRSLAERDPYQVARILIDATASMIHMQIHREDLDKVKNEDGSEIWCRRLDKLGHDYHVSRESLVNTLTFACEQVFEKSPESVADLDEALRRQRWKIFTRLRHYLYALHPNEQTQPWIREATLAHEDYARWEHYYEFQRMIRCACEHFDTTLLTEEERTQIFDTILSGPSKTGFQERMGEQFTEDRFAKRQRRFHRMRLRPFATVLFGKYADYFQQLEAEADEQISDEDYSPVGETEGGLMSRRSPQPPEALANLADEQLLVYINEWQEEHHDEDDWSVEINIEALAEAFQTVFKNAIIPDADRLRFWVENRERIERLIYVRAMISAMQEVVKAKHFDKLSEWLTFCEWVLAHPDREHEEGYGYKLGEESRENPHWHSSRRAVGDLVGTCLAEDGDVPVSAREHLAKLLDLLCTQFDWMLDEDKPVFLNSSDQITEAINNTRSRALESLVDFGLWLRRHGSEADVSEVTAILEKRFSPETERPLSLPEHAILGQKYGSIFLLDEVWATEHKSDFFPQDDLPAWVEAFENFLRFNRPFEPFLEVLRDDFEFALQQRSNIERQERLRGGPVDPLGRHLFTYYLWDLYPLKGETSLLERYYQQTDSEHSYWANLFDYVGRVLRNSGKHLDDALKDKAVQFLEWRLDAGESPELERFTFWMEAECLEPELRLDAYSRILDVVDSKGMGIFDPLKTLGSLLPEHTAKVVECFTKITASALKYSIYIPWKDQVKSILKAGLKSNDESVHENAKRARDNLLRSRRFDFLELDD